MKLSLSLPVVCVLNSNIVFLCGHLFFPLQLQGSSLETFLIIGRISSEAVLDAKRASRGSSLIGNLFLWVEQITDEARLFVMKIALLLLRLKKSYIST